MYRLRFMLFGPVHTRETSQNTDLLRRLRHRLVNVLLPTEIIASLEAQEWVFRRDFDPPAIG